MKIDISSGKYVVAVSGGVDSVALLDMLSKQPGLELIVAHFDHGMRPDSGKDRQFVQRLAQNYGLQFEYTEGKLGTGTSEEDARKARYAFLNEVRQKHGAHALITAHHQDDVLETVVINILRGTGRRGLSSLRSHPDLVRPLLDTPKEDLYKYARAHTLHWCEDPTNQDTNYTRNWVRHAIIPKLSKNQREQLLTLQKDAQATNSVLDGLLTKNFIDTKQPARLERKLFIALDHSLAKEVAAAWLRTNKVPFDAKTLEKLVLHMKSLSVGKIIPVSTGYKVRVAATYFELT